MKNLVITLHVDTASAAGFEINQQLPKIALGDDVAAALELGILQADKTDAHPGDGNLDLATVIKNKIRVNLIIAHVDKTVTLPVEVEIGIEG